MTAGAITKQMTTGRAQKLLFVISSSAPKMLAITCSTSVQSQMDRFRKNQFAFWRPLGSGWKETDQRSTDPKSARLIAESLLVTHAKATRFTTTFTTGRAIVPLSSGLPSINLRQCLPWAASRRKYDQRGSWFLAN